MLPLIVLIFYSQHPYIFFNQDHMTMTFVGFKVDNKGQCYDFKSEKRIEGCKVPVNVCECLMTQGVNLQKEDCNKWLKYAIIWIDMHSYKVHGYVII